MEKYQRGDCQAFEELVARYQKKVFNLAYRILGDYEEANDLAQDAFIKAYKKIKSFRKEASFYTWLYRIATNLYPNKMRRWQRVNRFQPISFPYSIVREGKEFVRSFADFNLDWKKFSKGEQRLLWRSE